MMKSIWVIGLCLAVAGCGGHRDFTEYSLDEKSFDSEAMAKIEQESGINLPDRRKGFRRKGVVSRKLIIPRC